MYTIISFPLFHNSVPMQKSHGPRIYHERTSLFKSHSTFFELHWLDDKSSGCPEYLKYLD